MQQSTDRAGKRQHGAQDNTTWLLACLYQPGVAPGLFGIVAWDSVFASKEERKDSSTSYLFSSWPPEMAA